MDGRTPARELDEEPRAAGDGRHGVRAGNGHVHFEVATPAHDEALRRLLRENPMRGAVSLSFEREPSYFAAAAVEGADHRTIVATEDGRVVCAGSVSSRMRYVNGEPMRVGYLGGLRLDAAARGRTSILLRGYALFRQLHEQQGGPAIYLTSIAADNVSARRVLEKGLSGMPTYHPLGEMVTLVIRRRENTDFHKPPARMRRHFGNEGLELVYGSRATVGALAELLARDQRRHQFAPVWSTTDLSGSNSLPGLNDSDFRFVRDESGKPVACAALWDQRAFKQAVIRGYAPWVRRSRLLLNVAARFVGGPRLPAIGRALSQAFVSHVAAEDDKPRHVEWLIKLLHGPACTREIDHLVLALDARDPRLPHLRQVFRPREYVTRLYAVHWNDGAAVARRIDPNRLLAPEVATL
jgi:hypothetical protein